MAGSAKIYNEYYKGFVWASSSAAGRDPGFLLYSGSFTMSNGGTYTTQYTGVGFEFIQDDQNFIRFRSQPSEFIVKSQKFFLGSEATQYISGSDGKLEISSSNFHVSNTGLVTAANFAEKYVQVTEANSASYFRDDGTTGVKLVFDGSGGQFPGYTGSVVLNMQLRVAPYNQTANAVKPISDVLIPTSIASRSCEVNVYISQSVTNVEFDNTSIAGSIARATDDAAS